MHITPSLHNNESGFITVVILILMAMVAILSTSLMDSQMLNNQILNAGKVDTQIYNLNQTISAAIYNNDSWTNSSSAGCMRDGSTCAIGAVTAEPAGTVFTLKDQQGNTIVDSAANAGFTLKGAPCNTYSAAGNDACPLKYTMTWDAATFSQNSAGLTTYTSCTTLPCTIHVRGTLTFSPGPNLRNLIINPNRYAIDIPRGKETSLMGACNSLGGQFTEYSSNCVVNPAVAMACPTGQFLVRSKNSGGAPECHPAIATTGVCPSGSAAVGFAADGQLDCRSVLDWK